MCAELNLQDFLNEVKTLSDPYHTHISISPRGVYNISSRMKTFWKLYMNEIQNKSWSIGENPGKEIPVLVDVDLRIKKSSIDESKKTQKNLKIYTTKHLEAVIRAYQNAIKQVVNQPKDEAYTCVVLEKDSYEVEICGEKYIKNGFHLHFPKIFLDKKVQEVYVIPIVKNETQNLFDDIGATNFIDENITNIHWLLYGSCKSSSKQPYIATKVYLKDVKETTFENALGDYQCIQYPKEKPIHCQGRVKEFLPRILSIFLHNRLQYFYYPKPSVTTPLLNEFQKIKHKRKEYDQLNVDNVLDEASQLIGLMNVERSDDRSVWLQVGFCLWQLTQGDDDGLTLWLEFSENSDKFNESECLSLWQKMRPNNYTIGTLKYWAKQDNPEKYQELTAVKSKKFVQMGTHNDYAKALYNEYGSEFICSSISNKEWYHFKDHIWRCIDKGQTLRERISSPDGVIIRYLEECIEQCADEKQRKKLEILIKQCKNSPTKNNIMTECQEVFYKENFINLMNKNPNLIAFKNGVYDFSNDVFRDGNPEDYLSICIPVEYKDYGSVGHPSVRIVDDFFQKIFPDPEVRDYFLDEACRCFIGGNHNKVVLFWTGTGDNGKTITQTLFEKMLGQLAIKFSTTLITGKKVSTGAPNPEMHRASNGVRWAVMDEPNMDETINCGILKWLSGNDTFWARDLFQKGKDAKEITPLFKLHMICNNLPAIQGADKATWNRIRVIPFESTFLPEEQCPKEIEEQMRLKKFPMDSNFSNKLSTMVEPLAWYLIQRWRTISKLTHCIIPAKVRAQTDIYRRNNDIYSQFINQCVFDKQGSILTFNTLYTHFKEWFREEAPNNTIPNRSIIRHYFISLWGEPEKGQYWVGKSCMIDIINDSGVESTAEKDTISDKASETSNDSVPQSPKNNRKKLLSKLKL
ncbi:MAG: phage/plasmid primase, P4 family [Enterobacter sp.]